MLFDMRNALACTAAQIRTAHWRSAVYPQADPEEDRCLSLVPLPNPRPRATRMEAWERKNPGDVRVFLANSSGRGDL